MCHFLSKVYAFLRSIENLLDPRGSILMPPPVPLVYLRPRVTLTFDLLTPKVDRLMPLSRWSHWPIGIKIN